MGRRLDALNTWTARMIIGKRLISQAELVALQAVMNTFVASSSSSSSALDNLQATDCITSSTIASQLHSRFNANHYRQILLILHLIRRPFTLFLLTGKYCCRPFHQQTVQERTLVLKRIANSRLQTLRVVFKVLRGISAIFVYSDGSGLIPSAVFDEIGYPRREDRCTSAQRPAKTPFRFIDVAKESPVMQFDVVIVGSGAGGSVTAAILAARLKGKTVVVLEKGVYVPAEEKTLIEGEAFRRMYEREGLVSSEEGGMFILAGSTFGGGTEVNFSGSLVPPETLRQEWSSVHDLPLFSSDTFESAIDAVCARLGVSADHVVHNRSNQILIDGCKQLGYQHAVIPQNTGNKPHTCGFCSMGCPSGTKQSASVSWLLDAHNAGASFIQNCFARRILIENGVAVGVEVIVDGNIFRINAQTVICSAGTIHSPALLLRSGLRNPHIGRHLALHPVCLAYGFFEEEVRCFEGSIMTAVSSQCSDLDGSHYGAKLEIPAVHFGAYSVMLPWTSSVEHKTDLRRYKFVTPICIIVRDRETRSTVDLDENSLPRIRFELSKFDSKTGTEGMVHAVRVLATMGATEIRTSQQRLRPFKPTSRRIDSPEFVAFEKEIRRIGVESIETDMFSAHQMGTCRMSSKADGGVVSTAGESWDCKNLYVVDASIFPTASGVNPMITNYALSYCVANTIADRLLASSTPNPTT